MFNIIYIIYLIYIYTSNFLPRNVSHIPITPANTPNIPQPSTHLITTYSTNSSYYTTKNNFPPISSLHIVQTLPTTHQKQPSYTPSPINVPLIYINPLLQCLCCCAQHTVHYINSTLFYYSTPPLYPLADHLPTHLNGVPTLPFSPPIDNAWILLASSGVVSFRRFLVFVFLRINYFSFIYLFLKSLVFIFYTNIFICSVHILMYVFTNPLFKIIFVHCLLRSCNFILLLKCSFKYFNIFQINIKIPLEFSSKYFVTSAKTNYYLDSKYEYKSLFTFNNF